MLILTIRTDKPEAELGLFNNYDQLGYITWPAHRQLSKTIHTQLLHELDKHQLKLTDLTGLVVYQGPGSFTGLRIGISLANAFSYGLNIPIVSASGQDWTTIGIKRLNAGNNETTVMPDYGAPAKVTRPRK